MRLRILTYNVHKCAGGLDRRCNPSRIAETIAHYEPDVVLLQEVVGPSPGHRHPYQADILGDLLGLPHRAYFAHIRLRSGVDYGNAVLSRLPISDWGHFDLTIGWRKKRAMVHARLQVPSPEGHARTLHVYNLHLGLSGGERKLQLRRFLDSEPFSGLHHDTPIVLGGDFNDVWGSLGPKILEPAGFRGNPQPRPTFPAFAPVRALDALYVRGGVRFLHERRSHLKLARFASDHLPVVADIVLI